MKQKITFRGVFDEAELVLIVDYNTDQSIGWNYAERFSDTQKRKFDKFEDECELAYDFTALDYYGDTDKHFTVIRHDYCVYDNTRDETGRFRTGYRVHHKGDKAIVQYLTNWQGDRDKAYILTEEEFESLKESGYDFSGEGQWGDLVWQSQKIQ